jgi:hypothetical protein
MGNKLPESETVLVVEMMDVFETADTRGPLLLFVSGATKLHEARYARNSHFSNVALESGVRVHVGRISPIPLPHAYSCKVSLVPTDANSSDQ